MHLPALRLFLIVGILVVASLVASACAATDSNDSPITGDSPNVTARPGPTPTLQPTIAPTSTPCPKPGLTRDDAVAIRLCVPVESRFPILYPDLHFCTVQLEEGTTYTADISDSLSRLAISITDSEAEVLARNAEPDGGRVSTFA